jgi:dTDP-4-dehydrorhamnose 3,5-epimerase
VSLFLPVDIISYCMKRLTVIEERFPGLKLLKPARYGDERGHFQEVYNQETYAEIGIHETFVQDNWSRSVKGTLRGMHYQLQHAQSKLLLVVTGSILDAVIDVRANSPHFGQVYTAELSCENGRQLFVPAGFAHGFCVLSDVADIHYKCTDFYHPEDEHGVHWSDPAVAIGWPKEITNPILSEKDCVLPRLSEVAEEFLPTL